MKTTNGPIGWLVLVLVMAIGCGAEPLPPSSGYGGAGGAAQVDAGGAAAAGGGSAQVDAGGALPACAPALIYITDTCVDRTPNDTGLCCYTCFVDDQTTIVSDCNGVTGTGVPVRCASAAHLCEQ